MTIAKLPPQKTASKNPPQKCEEQEKQKAPRQNERRRNAHEEDMPSQFIPARNSRHRVACIALFRALVREAGSIPLPDDVLRRGQNPIPRLIKKGFRRNRTETSYRIVFAALSTGYKFLNLFKSAQVESSKGHSEIVAYLREKNMRDARSEAGKPAPAPAAEPPQRPKWPPLLVNTAPPGEPPVYTSPRHPVPRDQLTGRRSVPHISVSTEGIAFLRQGKPQPHRVSRYVMRKDMLKKRAMDALLKARREDLPFATEEDRWETLMAQEMTAVNRAQGRSKRDLSRRQDKSRDLESMGFPDRMSEDQSYGWSVGEAYRFSSEQLHHERVNQVARARAFLEIQQAEKAMLEKEEREAREAGQHWDADTPDKKLQRKLKRSWERRARRAEGKAERKKKAWEKRLVGLKPAPIQV